MLIEKYQKIENKINESILNDNDNDYIFKNKEEEKVYKFGRALYQRKNMIGKEISLGENVSRKSQVNHYGTVKAIRVHLIGNTYHIKDELKEKGYKFDWECKAWYKDFKNYSELISDVEKYFSKLKNLMFKYIIDNEKHIKH